MQTISEIKEAMQAASFDRLPVFIETYETDGRAGVQKIVEAAKKRLEALKLEKQRIEGLRVYEEQIGRAHV